MLNKSYTYVLPMLSTEIALVKEGLVNTFIGDQEYPLYDNHIFLLYEFNGSITARVYEDGINLTAPGDLVAAFVGDEQRGVATAISYAFVESCKNKNIKN